MSGKLLPIMIIIVFLIVVGAVLFLFLHNNPPPIPPPTPPVVNEPPEFSVNQEVNEEEGVVNVSIDTSESPVEVNRTVLLNMSDELIEEKEGAEASFSISENGKYKITAYAVNERQRTKTINVLDVPEKRKSNPYVPENFKVLKSRDGDISPDDGFVVADENNNQYVWVPVESGNLARDTAYEANYEDDASELTNSVSKYYGFYVSRFEASRAEYDEEAAASVQGKMPWTEIDFNEAQNASRRVAEVLGYEGYTTSLLSSYAWDTILNWVDKDADSKDFSQSTEFGNYSGTVVPTGQTSSDKVKNIYDLAGNVKEWSTEIDRNLTTSMAKNSKDKQTILYRMIRGGSAEIANTPADRRGYPENNTNQTWGFRYILFKN
ncbi:MAG: SUMF1/EgtB/PvdO family nonheme iron enzyme [Clostridia bacterium]|nr:SUMF1/EgtB/PvdO family nonheme iron enzyme [Clostridia bacterium]